MLTPHIVFHRHATVEYRKALRRYGREGPRLKLRFIEAVEAVMDVIQRGPQQGAPYRGRFRWLKVRKFPFIVFYKVRSPDEICVYALAHERRRPGYWLGRARD